MKRFGSVALLVATVLGLLWVSSVFAGGKASLKVVQAVSGGTDTVTLSGTHWPPNTTVSWAMSFCPKSGGCANPAGASGTATTDASGHFTATPFGWTCDPFFTQIFANAEENQQVFADKRVKLAC